MAEGQCVCIAVAVVVGIGILLTVILVPMSFSGLEYYEFGFKRQKSTGTVETDRAYDGGKYMIGPDYEFKKFSATAHFVTLDQISVFTYDTLEIKVTVYFQYFLRQEDLPTLHKNYDINYEYVMRKSAIAALKGEAPNHKTWAFITDRKNVEASLFKAIRERLGGTCCEVDCSAWKFACPEKCIPRTRCNVDKDKGLGVNVKYLQMAEVSIHIDVRDRYLETLTLREETAREKLIQEAQVVRKQTVAEVKSIENDAVEIRQTAQSQAKLLRIISQANYTLTVERSRSQGLSSLYSRLKIDDQQTKNSFDYLRTLRGLDNVHLTVDFQQRIVGGV